MDLVLIKGLELIGILCFVTGCIATFGLWIFDDDGGIRSLRGFLVGGMLALFFCLVWIVACLVYPALITVDPIFAKAVITSILLGSVVIVFVGTWLYFKWVPILDIIKVSILEVGCIAFMLGVAWVIRLVIMQ